MDDFIRYSTLVSNLLTIAVQVWVLYQIRLLIGKEAARVLRKLND